MHKEAQILVTGSAGFLGKNVLVRLREQNFTNVAEVTRETAGTDVRELVVRSDIVIHLAGVNRSDEASDFQTVNADLTQTICETLQAARRKTPVILSSSTQANLENSYGRSKRAAELSVEAYAARTGAPCKILRLTNVFGKWSRPFYNSAVATFCHQVARGEPPSINDPSSPLRLIYVDDVVDALMGYLNGDLSGGIYPNIGPVYETTVGELAETLLGFAENRSSLVVPQVGTGFLRALYATYLSFMRPEEFSYELPKHCDPRGEFVEMLKTADSGQMSYFTSRPGVTRGEHYHHTKSEKFLVLAGTAQFKFRHVISGETHEITVSGSEARVVETVPGWAHNVSNVGAGDLIVMLWANESFDRNRPDTIMHKVDA